MEPCRYRPSLVSDPYGRYTTPAFISRLVISQISIVRPSTVLDLGAGSGTLAAAALVRWRRAHIITVDHDPAAPIARGRLSPTHRHVHADVLQTTLPALIGMPLGSVDAAICNPPFIRPKWRREYGDLLECGGFSGAFPAVQEAGADVLFIAQNLRLLKDRGQVSLIIPDGVIAGSKHRLFRRSLMAMHQVERVIELPRRAFERTDAQTYIVVLRKGVSTRKVELGKLRADGTYCSPMWISQDEAVRRLDYSYYEATHRHCRGLGPREARRLVDLGVDVHRGTLNSREVKQAAFFVFHSSNFPTDTHYFHPPAGRQVSRKLAQTLGLVIAEAGDILVCRIGRDLERKICQLASGRVPLSDCVYRLQVPARARERILRALVCERGRSYIHGISSGVAARQLPKESLITFPVPID